MVSVSSIARDAAIHFLAICGGWKKHLVLETGTGALQCANVLSAEH